MLAVTPSNVRPQGTRQVVAGVELLDELDDPDEESPDEEELVEDEPDEGSPDLDEPDEDEPDEDSPEEDEPDECRAIEVELLERHARELRDRCLNRPEHEHRPEEDAAQVL